MIEIKLLLTIILYKNNVYCLALYNKIHCVVLYGKQPDMNMLSLVQNRNPFKLESNTRHCQSQAHSPHSIITQRYLYNSTLETDILEQNKSWLWSESTLLDKERWSWSFFNKQVISFLIFEKQYILYIISLFSFFRSWSCCLHCMLSDWRVNWLIMFIGFSNFTHFWDGNVILCNVRCNKQYTMYYSYKGSNIQFQLYQINFSVYNYRNFH